MLFFKDHQGADKAAIQMMVDAANNLLESMSSYLEMSVAELDLVASAIAEEIRATRKGLVLWLPKKVAVTDEAKILAARAKKKIRNHELIVFCVSACRDAIAVSSEISKANTIIAATNLGGAITKFENYCARAKSAKVGALAREEKYSEIEKVVIAMWEAECDPSISADKAAEDIIGRVNLSHRKIADIIRAAKRSK